MSTSTKKKSASKEGGAAIITDIPHEDITVVKETKEAQEPLEVKAETEPEKPQLSLEVIKKNEITKFSQAEAEIQELFTLYGELTIAGPEDKVGYEKAKKAFSLVRSKRTGFEKIGKGIRDQFNAINKAVTEIEDKLCEKLNPLELKLKKMYEDVDKERERLDKEKEQLEQQQLNDRLKELMNMGMVFTDGYYSIGTTISLDVSTLRTLSAEQYAKVRDAVKTKSDELAEAKLLEDKADQERKDKLKLEKEKLEKEQKDLKDEQDKLKKEKEDLQKEKDELARMKLNARNSELQNLGMEVSMSGETLRFVNDAGEVKVKVADYRDLSPEAFNVLVVETRQSIEILKLALKEKELLEEADRVALDARKKRIAESMADAGLVYDYVTDTFSFQNTLYAYNQTMTQLLEWSDDALAKITADVKNQVVKAKKDQLAQEAKDKQKAETERKAKLGDAGNFREYLDNLKVVECAKMRSGHYSKRVIEFNTNLTKLINEFRPAEEAVKS